MKKGFLKKIKMVDTWFANYDIIDFDGMIQRIYQWQLFFAIIFIDFIEILLKGKIHRVKKNRNRITTQLCLSNFVLFKDV